MKSKSADWTLKLITNFRYKCHFERSTVLVHTVTWGRYTGGELFGGSIESTGARPLVNPDPTPAF